MRSKGLCSLTSKVDRTTPLAAMPCNITVRYKHFIHNITAQKLGTFSEFLISKEMFLIRDRTAPNAQSDYLCLHTIAGTKISESR